MIEMHNVSFSYQGEEQNLRNIHLTISPGECVLLCGVSGCGKTTITKMINGLIPHFETGELEGQTLVNGRLVSNTPLYELSQTEGGIPVKVQKKNWFFVLLHYADHEKIKFAASIVLSVLGVVCGLIPCHCFYRLLEQYLSGVLSSASILCWSGAVLCRKGSVVQPLHRPFASGCFSCTDGDSAVDCR